MYKLTLTHSERKAMDFAGYRYFYGSDLTDILWCDCTQLAFEGNFAEWEDKCDITFIIEEHIAWGIKEELDEETEDWKCSLACASDEFTKKLRSFCEEIV